MTQIAIICLFSILPHRHTPSASVDYIEVSHFYNERGEIVFDQLIFRDWAGRQYECRDWRLIKEPWQSPAKDHSTGIYSAILGESHIDQPSKSTIINHPVIRARSLHESWLQYDIELTERESLPKEMRRPLKFR